jgi:hypothetical protein
MQTYEEHLKCRQSYKEHADCAVRALSNLLDCSYGLAHRKLAKHGRKHGKGSPWYSIRLATKEICEMKSRTVSWHGYPEYSAAASKFGGYNVQTIGQFQRSHPKGVYLIAMRGHVVAVVDGELIDWTASTSRRHKVTGHIKLEG